MKRFKNILLITNKNDINSPDIQRAVSLARANAASLTLADVFYDLPFIHQKTKPSPGVASVFSGMAEKRLQELKSMVRELSTDLEITSLVLQGTPFWEIIRVVMQLKCDLVIKM
jgi:nucleotide-binding universal stress UspA family protein